jgi:hypothetical protein
MANGKWQMANGKLCLPREGGVTAVTEGVEAGKGTGLNTAIINTLSITQNHSIRACTRKT